MMSILRAVIWAFNSDTFAWPWAVIILRFQRQIENYLFWYFCAGLGLVSISPLSDIFNLHSQKTAQCCNRPVQILNSFDGNTITKQKIAVPEKIKYFRYLFCLTKVVKSRSWSVFNFNHNNTGIKYSSCPPVLSEVNRHL